MPSTAPSPADVRRVQAFYPRIYLACHVRHVRAKSSDATLSPSDASLLAHLDEDGSVGAGDLARHLGVTPATLSAASDRLVELGYVLRSRPASDRRKVELRLSAKGATAMSRSSVLDESRVRTVLARLPAADRRRAIDGLALLARASTESTIEETRTRRTGR